jgi:hypothetical protein
MEQNIQPSPSTPPASPEQITAQTSAHPPAPAKRKIIILLIALLGIIFFSPVPYYQAEEVECIDGQPCPAPGWHTHQSLFQNILSSHSQSTGARPVQNGVTTPAPAVPSPTPNPMAEWKTYNGNVYTFKYPSGYTIKSDGGGTVVTVSDAAGVFLSIFSLETPTYDNFINCTDTLKAGCMVNFQPQTDLITNITVDGRGAKSFYFTGLEGDTSYTHKVEVVESPTTAIQAIIGNTELGKTEAEVKDNIFNQILSTFKFSDQTTDTSNWKTYTDPKNTYSFKYPVSLQLKAFNDNSLILTGVDGNDKIPHEFRINPYIIPAGVTLYQFIYGGGVGDNYGKTYLDGNKVSLTFNDVSQNSLYKIWEPSQWPSANGILIKFIQYKNQLLWFSLEPYNPGGTPIPYEKENVQLFNQILSTFTFTQ